MRGKKIVDNWTFRTSVESSNFSGIGNIINKANLIKDDVIRLEAGDIDFTPPKSLLDNIVEEYKQGKTHYPSFRGDANLIQKVKDIIKADYNVDISVDNILITSGGSMGVYIALQTLVECGDEVIVPEPVWPHLAEMVTISGAVPIRVKTNTLNNFHLDINKIEEAITARTKVIIINSPNNPTGTIYTYAEIEELIELCKKYELAIISDEEYELFCYGERKLISPFSMYEGTVVSRSFSKTIAIPGLRLGYLVGPREWINRMIKMSLFSIMYNSSLIQPAVAKTLEDNTFFMNNMREVFEQRSIFMSEGFNQIEGIKCYKPEGGLYLWVDCSECSMDDVELAEYLLEKCRVATVPGSYFGEGGKGFLRISLGCSDKRLREALLRIKNVLNIGRIK